MRREDITPELAEFEVNRLLEDFKINGKHMSPDQLVTLKKRYFDFVKLMVPEKQIPHMKLRFREEPKYLAELLKWDMKSYAKSGLLHDELYKAYKDALTDNKGYKKLAIAVPRNHAKTSTLVVFLAICIAEGWVKFAVIVSETYTVACLMLGELKLILESPRFIAIYGSFKGSTWTENEIVTKHPNGSMRTKVTAIGQGQQVRGLIFDSQRPDIAICDDLESNELVANKDRIDQLESWFHGAFLPALDRYATVIYVGTILHFNSMLARVINPKKYNAWHKIFWAATRDGTCDLNSQPVWPEYWPIELLIQKRQEYIDAGKLDEFNTEYMNNPVPEGTATFKKADFRYFTNENSYFDNGKNQQVFSIDGLHLTYYTTVDLAVSEKDSADYTIVMTVGVSDDGRIFVMEYFRERCQPDATIDEIFRQYDVYKPIYVLIETVGFQATMLPAVQKEELRRKKPLPLYPYNGKGDKTSKIKSLQPIFRQGKIHMRTNMEELEEELIRFPKAAHDDLPDALQMALFVLDPIKEDSPKKGEKDRYGYAKMPTQMLVYDPLTGSAFI